MWFSRFFQDIYIYLFSFSPTIQLSSELYLAGISGKDNTVLTKSENLLKVEFSRPAHLFCGKNYHHTSIALFAWSHFLWFSQLEGNQKKWERQMLVKANHQSQRQLHMFEITLWFFQFDFYCLFGLNTCHSCYEAKDHEDQCSLISHCFNTSLL